MFTNAEEKEKVAEIKSQLDEIVRSYKSGLQVWNRCHTAGWPLVNDLAKTHCKCLTITKNLQKHTNQRQINMDQLRLRRSRNEIKKTTERLLHMVDRLLDSNEHARQSLHELRKLCGANDLAERIFYRNWNLRDILEFAESIMPLYDAEYEIKEMVVEELTNCKDHEEVKLIRQAWYSPRHALTKEFNSLFKAFNFETHEVDG